MSKVKVQHYVPQFYLNYFCNEQERLWVFDKQENKSFTTNPKNVGAEGYFYDLNQKNPNQQEQFLENLFADFEANFAVLFSEFIAGVSSGEITVLDQTTKSVLSKYLTIQILRTNETREHQFQLIKTLKQSIIDKGWGDQIDFSKFGLDESQIDRKDGHIHNLLMNIPARDALDEALSNHIWLVFKNKTGMPLYTSDHPVVKNPNIWDPVRSMSGYNSEGIELAFPLTPDIIFSIGERTFFKNAEAAENLVLDITDEQNIIYFNSLQVTNSYRQVYSKTDNFDLPKEMVNTHPDLRDPKRKRVDSA